FDKTGTLTLGQPEVKAVRALTTSEDELLAWVAAAQLGSGHPLGLPVIELARERGLALPEAKDVAALPGRGVAAVVDGRAIVIGSRRLISERGVAVAKHETEASVLETQGMTLMWIAEPARGVLLGYIGVADSPRPGAAEAVAELVRRGL